MNTAGRSMLISEADLENLRELLAGMCARHRHSVALSERGGARHLRDYRGDAIAQGDQRPVDADPRQHFSILVIRRLAHWLWVIGAYALVFGLMMIFLAFRSPGAGGRDGWRRSLIPGSADILGG